MAFTAEHSTPHFWLERDLIVLTTIVTNDLESLRSVLRFGDLSRATLRAALGRHHVPLVKDLLLFFGEQEGLFTLNARGFDVRHYFSPF